MNVRIGTKFHFHYADGNPQWTVTENRGRGTWIAEIKEDVDWVGAKQAFTTSQIQRCLAAESYWKQSQDDSTTFYQKLAPGSIVHYNNGGNSFVRCQVTSDHQLVPIALVGDWFGHDLPRRNRDGSIDKGYFGRHMGKPFQPHASNVWEYNITQTPNRQPINFKAEKDPRQLTPICLDLPPMTAEEEKVAKKWQKLQWVRNVAKNDDPDTVFAILKNGLDDNAI